MSNITTRANSQFPRPDFHRQDKQHYGLQAEARGDAESSFQAWPIPTARVTGALRFGCDPHFVARPLDIRLAVVGDGRGTCSVVAQVVILDSTRSSLHDHHTAPLVVVDAIVA